MVAAVRSRPGVGEVPHHSRYRRRRTRREVVYRLRNLHRRLLHVAALVVAVRTCVMFLESRRVLVWDRQIQRVSRKAETPGEVGSCWTIFC